MILLGILAMIQVLFLPGILAFKLVKPTGGILKKLIYIIGISFILNYLLVFLLTGLHIYIQAVVLLIMVVEVGAVIYFYKAGLTAPVRDTFTLVWERIAASLKWLLNPEPVGNSTANLYEIFRKYALIITAFVAVGALVHMAQIFLQNIPSVFNTYDAIVSWNRWATEWAQNTFPTSTQDYPQLGPTLYSMTYVILGTAKVQLFAKALMPLFLVLIMLMFFDLGLEKPSYGILLGVEIVYLVVKHFMGEYIGDGYMDIPLAFFAFLAVYTLLKSRRAANEREKVTGVLLGFFFAAGAAITKQPGIYILIIYPFLAILIHGWKNIREWISGHRKLILYGLLLAGLVVIPWYALKAFQFTTGSEASHLLIPVARTSTVFGTLNIIDKISSGLLSLGKYAAGFLFILPALFLMDPAIRWISLLIVLPFTLLWSGYASYDVRNVTLVWAFYSLVIAVSLEAYIQWFFKIGERILGQHRLRWWGVILTGIILAAAGAVLLPTSRIMQEQEKLQRQILNPDLNQELYAYFEANPSQGKILTNYPVDYLPGFEGRQFYFLYDNLKDFEWALKLEEVKFLLVPSFASDEVKARLQKGVADGELTPVFSNDSFIPEKFYTINR